MYPKVFPQNLKRWLSFGSFTPELNVMVKTVPRNRAMRAQQKGWPLAQSYNLPF